MEFVLINFTKVSILRLFGSFKGYASYFYDIENLIRLLINVSLLSNQYLLYTLIGDFNNLIFMDSLKPNFHIKRLLSNRHYSVNYDHTQKKNVMIAVYCSYTLFTQGIFDNGDISLSE